MTSKTDVTQRGAGLIEALHVTGPAAEYAGKLMLFGRFVGSWRLEWTGPDTGGQPATMTGELHFGWVLGGRAVQDIWIVPGRGEPGEGQPPPQWLRNASEQGTGAGQDGRARTAQIWLIGAPGPAPSRSSLQARIRHGSNGRTMLAHRG